MDPTLLGSIIAFFILCWLFLLAWAGFALFRRVDRFVYERTKISLSQIALSLVVLAVLGAIGFAMWQDENGRSVLLITAITPIALATLMLLFAGLGRINQWLAKRTGVRSGITGTIEFFVLVAVLIWAFLPEAIIPFLILTATLTVFMVLVYLGGKLQPIIKKRLGVGLDFIVGGVVAIVITVGFIGILLRQMPYETLALAVLPIGGGILWGVGTLLDKFLKRYFKIGLGTVVAIIVLGVGGLLLYQVDPFLALVVGSTLGLIAAFMFVIWAIPKMDAWLLRRYNISPSKAFMWLLGKLITALLWLVVIGVTVGSIGAMIVGVLTLLIEAWREILLTFGILAGVALILYLIYRVGKWIEPQLKKRFNISLGDIVRYGVIGLIILVVGGGMVVLFFTDEEFRAVMIIMLAFVLGIMALAFGSSVISSANEAVEKRFGVGLIPAVARVLLIPLIGASILFAADYSGYVVQLMQGEVVDGELLSLEQAGLTYTAHYRFDPNYGDPPDVRTHTQGVSPYFYETHSGATIVPIFFVRDADDSNIITSSISLVPDAQDRLMLTVILVLATSLLLVGVVIHGRSRVANRPSAHDATPVADSRLGATATG